MDTLSGNELGKTLLRLISHFSNKLTNIVDGHDIYANTTGNMGNMGSMGAGSGSMGGNSPIPGSGGGSGGGSGSGSGFESGELFGGARIAHIFNEVSRLYIWCV
mgnify:FL=1